MYLYLHIHRFNNEEKVVPNLPSQSNTDLQNVDLCYYDGEGKSYQDCYEINITAVNHFHCQALCSKLLYILKINSQYIRLLIYINIQALFQSVKQQFGCNRPCMNCQYQSCIFLKTELARKADDIIAFLACE